MKDLIGNPAGKLKAELKSIGFKFGLKDRRTLGCLAELISLTAEVARQLTLPVAVFRNCQVFGYEFEHFLPGFVNNTLHSKTG